jgi:hypothetical protein
MTSILIDSPITGKRESLTQDQFNSYMAQTNGAVLKWIVNPVAKHGTHDQKTHGNWATGGASGVSNDELKRAYQDFQGLSEETGYSAVYSYTHNGYEILNTYLRTDSFSNDLMEDAKGRFPALLVDAAEIDEMDNQRVQMRGILNATTSALDTAIDEAPQVLEDKIVFRVVSVDALKDLKEGDVFTEKGYVSTTSVDLRKDSKLRENLAQIDRKTDDVVALIYNGKNGKGLSVNGIQEAAANKNAFENEIILPRGRDFKFIGKDKDGNYLIERQN